MLGLSTNVNPNEFKAEVYAFYTFVVIFLANLVYDLFALFNATGALPAQADLILTAYADFLFSAKSTIAIYIVNKGIKFARRNSEGS